MLPFENDHEALSISGLTIENGMDLIALHGTLELARDRRTLNHIKALESVLGTIKARLLAQENLPEVATTALGASMVDIIANPFGDN